MIFSRGEVTRAAIIPAKKRTQSIACRFSHIRPPIEAFLRPDSPPMKSFDESRVVEKKKSRPAQVELRRSDAVLGRPTPTTGRLQPVQQAYCRYELATSSPCNLNRLSIELLPPAAPTHPMTWRFVVPLTATFAVQFANSLNCLGDLSTRRQCPASDAIFHPRWQVHGTASTASQQECRESLANSIDERKP